MVERPATGETIFPSGVSQDIDSISKHFLMYGSDHVYLPDVIMGKTINDQEKYDLS